LRYARAVEQSLDSPLIRRAGMSRDERFGKSMGARNVLTCEAKFDSRDRGFRRERSVWKGLSVIVKRSLRRGEIAAA
jgi:hypothetical protein